MKSLDHRFLNELDYFRDGNPSSENIARYIARTLRKKISASHIQVSKVTAWESEDACATYYTKSE
jgi:6-pyruvoyltetrahydropterin/6-carboxytetrahydropterin synthase